jgi:DNA polymerase-4
MIEPFGIDESWLDVTASSLFGTGEQIAEKIRCEMRESLGITVSIGVSFNKVFAKLGSDYKKPDAITVITRENFRSCVYPMDVSSLLFVGRRTSEQLRQMGIKTVGDLAAASPDLLTHKFGKMGAMISSYARGEDDSPVCASDKNEAKSIGNGYTFKHDLVGRESCRVGINYLAEEIGTKLRARGMKCASVQISIKDEYLRTIQRMAPQDPPSNISEEIADTAYSILCRSWSEEKPVRMLTVTAMNLVREDMYAEQLDFFDTACEAERVRKQKREMTVDEIREKFGRDSIVRGSVINNDIGINGGGKK